MDAITEKVKETRNDLMSKTHTIEEFKTIFKYLAFVACAAKAPIRQKLLDETLDRISKAGDSENIQRWCFWTPSQLSLMELADKIHRMVIIGGNGTGKTLMLDTYATKLANEQKDVIIVIHHTHERSGWNNSYLYHYMLDYIIIFDFSNICSWKLSTASTIGSQI